MAFRPSWKAVRLPLLLSLLWCLFMVGLYQRAGQEKDAHTSELALTQARTLYAQVLDTRSWNAAHGGVYVPESAYGAPNPWIPEAQRTLRLADGQRLVLMNPAYMSRQIGDLSSVKGTSFRITSHAPLRPENASDMWETQALTRCMEGASEVFALSSDGGSPRYRYLRALHAQRDCLTCHAGSTVGEVRGGISVSLDARPFVQASMDQERSLRWAFGLMGFTGVLGIGGTSFLAQRRRMLSEERERMKSAFLANMSHDMRTPLTGIMGMTDLLERPQNEQQKREALRYLHLAGAALLEMVSDITDYAALDAGQVRLHEKSCDVRLMVRRCEELFQPQCRAKGLYLQVDVEPEVPPCVMGDEFRLRQLLGNLISNAVKFTAQGGIVVTVSRGLYVPGMMPAPAPGPASGPASGPAVGAPGKAAHCGGEKTVNTQREGRHGGCSGERCLLRFAVQDTGQGIAPQDQQRIFERFERASASSDGRGGTGLGLAIALDLARLMGGWMEVQSQLGQGARFTFNVCCAVPPPCPPGPESDIPVPSHGEGQGRTVLVGEDNTITAHYLEQVLTRAGYVTHTVDDGLKVLDTLEKSTPDLLMLDMRMPGLDGLATARAVRARLATLPMVILSASVSDEERAAFAALGVSAHLLKPVGAAALLRVVAAALEGGAQNGSVQEHTVQEGCAEEAGPGRHPADSGTPCASAPHGTPFFDRDAALEDLEGDGVLLHKLAALWLAEVEPRREELVRAAQTGDMATVRRVAHGWKNSSAVLHLPRLHGLCTRLEQVCTEPAGMGSAATPLCAVLLPQILAAVEASAVALRRGLDKE